MNKNEGLKNEVEQTREEIKSLIEQAFANKSNIRVTFKDKNNSTLRKYGMQQFGTLDFVIERMEANGVLIFIDDDGQEGDVDIDGIKKVEILTNES